jgi:hypothetical protein
VVVVNFLGAISSERGLCRLRSSLVAPVSIAGRIYPIGMSVEDMNANH